MSAQHAPGPRYEFVAARFYAEHERYSSGSGLSVSTGDLTEAERLFALYESDPRDETYCLTITRLDTGETLKHSGPSPKDTERSMLRAYRKRFERAKEARRVAATGSTKP